MNIEKIVNETSEKLAALGINAEKIKHSFIKHISNMPEDIVNNMEENDIIISLISNIGSPEHDFETGTITPASDKVFHVSTEALTTNTMYTNIIRGVAAITSADLTFTDIIEDTSKVNFEEGKGIQTISFQCNKKPYKYDAKVDYDWLDHNVLTFIGKIIEEQKTGKFLYILPDTYGECMLFYEAEDWAERFNSTLGLHIMKVKI